MYWNLTEVRSVITVELNMQYGTINLRHDSTHHIPSLIYFVTAYTWSPSPILSPYNHPLPLAATSVFFVLWACFVSIFIFFLKFHVCKWDHMVFVFISLIVLSRSVYVVANDKNFTFYEWIIFHICHIFFINSSISGHLVVSISWLLQIVLQ